jgi:zinc D-Ala-D-Ala carboxypeptidase
VLLSLICPIELWYTLVRMSRHRIFLLLLLTMPPNLLPTPSFLLSPIIFRTCFLLFTFSFLLFPVTAQTPLPSCRYDDIITKYQDYNDWHITLLDPIYKLPDTYAPPDLVSTTEAGLTSDYKIRAIVIEPLKNLLQAASSSSSPLEIQSAYRSYSYQVTTFESWVSKEGQEAALKSSARPGHSEHQLGTALDFKEAGGKAPWDIDDFAQTPGGAWLSDHAWEYGFIMSYSKEKESLTCYIYEPWHYRYVGLEVAKAVKESGLSLREWLWNNQ